MNILHKYHFHLFVTALISIGLIIFVYKYWVLNLPLTPVQQTPVWTIEAQINFTAGNDPIKATLQMPNNPINFRILNQQYVSRRYGVTTLTKNENKSAIFAIRKAHGLQELFYRVSIYHGHSPSKGMPAPTENIVIPKLNVAEKAAITGILQQVKAQSADVSTLAAGVIKQLNALSAKESNAASLLSNDPSAYEIALTAVKVLSTDNIHAEILNCLDISQEAETAETIPWLAVWSGSEWIFLDPVTGNIGLPANYLVWSQGDSSLLQVKGGSSPQLRFSIARDERDTLAIAQQHLFSQNPALLDLSLFSLPLKTQHVYKQLFMVPLGVFIILLLRSFVGIKTFGTFMPILVALAFRETFLFPGLLLFALIIALGLTARFYLEQFKLLLIPRLSAVLIVVILLMAALNILLNKLGLSTGLSVALFPMVVMTMTIERMSMVWDERGGHEAFLQGLGSLFAASLGYLIMESHYIQHIVFIFPELLLVLLALVILVGRYKGYRLMELYRFSDLIRTMP